MSLGQRDIEAIAECVVHKLTHKLTALGFARPRGDVALRSRRAQAGYLGISVSTLRRSVLPLLGDVERPSRGDLDRAWALVRSERRGS